MEDITVAQVDAKPEKKNTKRKPRATNHEQKKCATKMKENKTRKEENDYSELGENE